MDTLKLKLKDHALKLEELDIKQDTADSIVSVLTNFVSMLGFSKDRIENLDCRRQDGFIPYSHNMGGISCVAYQDQESAYINSSGTGFANADATIERYRDMDIKNFEESFGVKYDKWSEVQQNEFEESRTSDDQLNILYGLDIMYKGFSNEMHSINLRFTVCVKDAPYHRQYDDLIDINLEFKHVESLKNKLIIIFKRKDVKQFSKCLNDSF